MMRSFVPYVMFWLAIDVILIKLCDTGQLLADAGIDYNSLCTDIRCTFNNIVFFNIDGKLFLLTILFCRWGGEGCSDTNYFLYFLFETIRMLAKTGWY